MSEIHRMSGSFWLRAPLGQSYWGADYDPAAGRFYAGMVSEVEDFFYIFDEKGRSSAGRLGPRLRGIVEVS